ncbi:cytochrome c3 family protein [Hydrogenimonas sp.]
MRAKFIGGLSALAFFASSVAASMIGTAHDLHSAEGGGNDEICVYCHTPHASNYEFTGAPLWNKPTTATTFTMYGATATGVPGQTIAGTATDASPSGASLACLSCHDGVSAINSVVNAPGSGGYNPSGSYIGQADYTPKDMPNSPEIAIGFGGDLTNDHPVSITYVEGVASLKPKDTAITGWNRASTINDLLRNGKVQCVSCHDPHYPNNGRYLRTTATGSNVCKTCHEK